MDIERFEALESQVVQLVRAFVHVKEEKKKLSQIVNELQKALSIQQKELEGLQIEREELGYLRNLVQSFQKEREMVRQELEQISFAIDQLEGSSCMKDNARM